MNRRSAIKTAAAFLGSLFVPWRRRPAPVPETWELCLGTGDAWYSAEMPGVPGDIVQIDWIRIMEEPHSDRYVADCRLRVSGGPWQIIKLTRRFITPLDPPCTKPPPGV